MQEYELDAAMAKATQLRANEKAKNTLIIQDAQDAQTAFAQMLLLFKEFHAKAAVATALVQQSDVLDAPYAGIQSKSGRVVGVLEAIEPDSTRLESVAKAAEDTAPPQPMSTSAS